MRALPEENEWINYASLVEDKESFQMIKSELRATWQYSDDKCPLRSSRVGFILLRVNFQGPRNSLMQKQSWFSWAPLTTLNPIEVRAALGCQPVYPQQKQLSEEKVVPSSPPAKLYPVPLISMASLSSLENAFP